MSGSRILVADFAPSGGVGSTLVTMLGKELGEGAQLRQEPCPLHLLRSMAPDLSRLLREYAPDLTLWVLSPEHGPEFTPLFRQLNLRLCQNLVVTGTSDPSLLHGYLQSGVRDFILTPLKEAEVLSRVRRALDLAAGTSPRQRGGGRGAPPQMIGRSPAFLQEIAKIPLVARSDASVLVLGETGTGKELCARGVHHLSARADKPFVTVNCGAIPLELMENELFGHEKEAFTGASTGTRGLIREAEGGTILLDEIDSLPAAAQVKLLRFLQEKEIRPLGSTRTIQADVRVLAATNVDPEILIEQGKLRRDLYYRIHVLAIRLPPLRERREDIPLLLDFFLERHRRPVTGQGTQVAGFTPCALRALMMYAWPGNVRELEHVVERAVLLCPGELISEREIVLPRSGDSDRPTSFQQAKAQVVADFERKYLTSLLMIHRGNVSHAAMSARKNRRAFFQLLQKHGLDVSLFRAAR